MLAGVRVTLPRHDQLDAQHPCRFKAIYYASYVEPVKDALRAVGIEPEPAGKVERGVIARFFFPDGREVAAIVDYADQVHVDGLVAYARGQFDFVFKMKPCDRFASEYDANPEPVLPWGYLIAPANGGDVEECNGDRRWFHESLPRLRDEQDMVLRGDRIQGLHLMTRGSYHALHHCERRRAFYDADLFQGEKLERQFREHVEDCARSGALLNLCGPDVTIDRKVVEACAIGVPLVSDDGLRDLRLPWGRRFVHGENVWFVENVAQLKAIAGGSLPHGIRARLSAGGRALYEACFAPVAIGQWMLCIAERMAK